MPYAKIGRMDVFYIVCASNGKYTTKIQVVQKHEAVFCLESESLLCVWVTPWSRTGMGGWRVARSPILGTTLTLERLKQRGYTNWVNYYHQND